MPQLKKVVLAMGDRLIYRDTFEQALAELTSGPAADRARSRRRPPPPLLRRSPGKTHPHSPNASAAFMIRPNNSPGNWRRWKKMLRRNRFELFIFN